MYVTTYIYTCMFKNLSEFVLIGISIDRRFLDLKYNTNKMLEKSLPCGSKNPYRRSKTSPILLPTRFLHTPLTANGNREIKKCANKNNPHGALGFIPRNLIHEEKNKKRC